MNCVLFWVLKRLDEEGSGEGGEGVDVLDFVKMRRSQSTFLKNQTYVQ